MTNGDPLEQASEVVREAADSSVPLRLIGGLAFRFLTPDFIPRERQGQDMDLASVSSAKSVVAQFLTERGFVADKSFNALYGHKQMYFVTPDGARAVDVIMDQLNMCHVLDFKDRIGRMPFTLDLTDLLLTKLQIVELNEKDAHDLLYLLSAYEVRGGDEPGAIGLGRFGQVVGGDWGWWRTATMNLERVADLAAGDLRHLVPSAPPFDAIEQARSLRQHAEDAPKSLKWKLRARVGDRVRWYEEPEEIAH